jgi:4-amino-4-deoxy-L-arabinose transferase-like glycosyltransferase
LTILHARDIIGFSQIARKTTMRLRDLTILIFLGTLFFGLFLGSRPLSVPDEGRYAEIPREMVVTGDWLTPRLNGVKYFEKPPLVYWFTALSIRLFGLSEWSSRLAPALFALMGCLSLYVTGATLFNRRTGVLSAIVLATSVLYYAISRTLILDMPVTALITVSLCSFLIALRQPDGWKRLALLYAFYAGCGLTMLTKGLIGIVIPGMIIFVWMLVMNQWSVLRSLYLPSGLILFLLIAAPWHILVQRANPEFFNFYFIHEHLQRYLTKVHGRYKPFWYFIPVLAGGLFPWSAFLVQAVRRALPRSWKDRHLHREMVFLLLWAGLIFLFFSASSSKLAPYILPVFPPLALIIGKYLADAWEQGAIPGLHGAYVGLAILASVLAVALALLPRFRPEIDAAVFRPYSAALIVILLAGVASTWFQNKRHGIQRSLSVLITATSLFLITANTAMPHLDTRSMKDEVQLLKPMIRPGDEIMSYHTYYQDLPVYLERTITVVEWTGEMNFGTTVEDTSGWMINENEFLRRWNGPNRVFLVTNQENYVRLMKSGLGKYHIAEQSPSPQHVTLVNREKPL